MARVDADFREKVYSIVGQIPKGRLMTYGQIATVCGVPWAAWEVGQIAHTGPGDLPWQRVVNKQGGLARGYPGGMEGHKQALIADGVEVSDYQVEIEKLSWQP